MRQHLPYSTVILKEHKDQTCSNNKSNQPPTYTVDAAASLTQYTVPEPSLNPEVFSDQELHHTPDTLRLPGNKNHFLFDIIYDYKGQIFIDETERFLASPTSVHSCTLVLYDYDINYIFLIP